LFCCRNPRPLRLVLPPLFAAEVLACAAPQPPTANPFTGTWTNADNDSVTIRQDTVVEQTPNGPNMPLNDKTCNGIFSFRYTVWNRDTLIGLVSRQPNLGEDLSRSLTNPTYPVAVLHCDHGDHTYVMLNSGELLAIYRDGDIGAVEHLARR
jgi:hypothetical protein